ncbi:transglutaminase domain-containing protein [Pontibacter toksunensis]|uniref:Transglutaminase domain-containing protein n=1 Tax=Pontibacter toksunensis TaxID=1332631 RepID=A0ABW6BRC6_9BACT
MWLLTHKYEYDHEKMRAIFLWIQHNISYDHTYRSYTYYRTFKSRKGICAGYSILIHKMFSYAGIKAKLVIGDLTMVTLTETCMLGHM